MEIIMRKSTKKITALIAILVLCLSGCSRSEPASAPADITPSPAPTATQAARKTIGITDDNSKYADMTVYQDCEYDITGTGNEKIELLTDAQKDSDGTFMWDDSHNWALIVKTDKGIYPLYSEYTHAQPSMNVSEYSSSGKEIPVIRLSIPSSASFEIREYRFENNSFVEAVPYSTGAMNELPINQY